MQDLAKLLELTQRAANNAAALEEAKRSIRRMIGETAQGATDLWVAFHDAWGQALAKIFATYEAWRLLGRQPHKGDLGLAVKEGKPKLRVILGASNGTVRLAELGESGGVVKFQSDFVAVTGMPNIFSSKLYTQRVMVD